MELEVIEASGGLCTGQEEKDLGCPEGGLLIGCCIIHFWCWEPGHGLCC